MLTRHLSRVKKQQFKQKKGRYRPFLFVFFAYATLNSNRSVPAVT
jgi:hypothetical protein